MYSYDVIKLAKLGAFKYNRCYYLATYVYASVLS